MCGAQVKWCTLFETKYTTTLLKQFQATDSTIIIIIIIDYTVKSMITSVTVATRHHSSNQTFDSSFHWRSSFSPHFQNPHYLTLKSWLQMICMTYTNVENYIKRNIPIMACPVKYDIDLKKKYWIITIN